MGAYHLARTTSSYAPQPPANNTTVPARASGYSAHHPRSGAGPPRDSYHQEGHDQYLLGGPEIDLVARLRDECHMRDGLLKEQASEIDKLRAAVAQDQYLSEALRKMERSYNMVKAQAVELEEKQPAWQAEVDRLHGELRRYDAERSAEVDGLHAALRLAGAREDDLAGRAEQLDEAQSALKNVAKSREKLSSELEDREVELERARRENRDLREAARVAKDEAQNRAEEVASLKTDRESLKARVEVLEPEVKDLAAKTQRLEASNSAAEARTAELLGAVTEAKQQLVAETALREAKLKTVVEEHAAALGTARDATAAAERSREDTVAVLADRDAQIAAVKASLVAALAQAGAGAVSEDSPLESLVERIVESASGRAESDRIIRGYLAEATAAIQAKATAGARRVHPDVTVDGDPPVCAVRDAVLASLRDHTAASVEHGWVDTAVLALASEVAALPYVAAFSKAHASEAALAAGLKESLNVLHRASTGDAPLPDAAVLERSVADPELVRLLTALRDAQERAIVDRGTLVGSQKRLEVTVNELDLQRAQCAKAELRAQELETALETSGSELADAKSQLHSLESDLAAATIKQSQMMQQQARGPLVAAAPSARPGPAVVSDAGAAVEPRPERATGPAVAAAPARTDGSVSASSDAQPELPALRPDVVQDGLVFKPADEAEGATAADAAAAVLPAEATAADNAVPGGTIVDGVSMAQALPESEQLRALKSERRAIAAQLRELEGKHEEELRAMSAQSAKAIAAATDAKEELEESFWSARSELSDAKGRLAMLEQQQAVTSASSPHADEGAELEQWCRDDELILTGARHAPKKQAPKKDSIRALKSRLAELEAELESVGLARRDDASQHQTALREKDAELALLRSQVEELGSKQSAASESVQQERDDKVSELARIKKTLEEANVSAIQKATEWATKQAELEGKVEHQAELIAETERKRDVALAAEKELMSQTLTAAKTWEAEATAAAAANAKINADNDRLTATLSDARAAADNGLKERIYELQHQREEDANAVKAAKSELANYKRAVATELATLRKHKKILENQLQELSDTSDEAAAAVQRGRALQEENANLQQKNDDLAAEVEDLQGKIVALQEEMREAKEAEAARRKNEMENADKMAAKQDAQIKELQSRLKAVTGERDQLKIASASMRRELEELTAVNAQLTNALKGDQEKQEKMRSLVMDRFEKTLKQLEQLLDIQITLQKAIIDDPVDGTDPSEEWNAHCDEIISAIEQGVKNKEQMTVLAAEETERVRQAGLDEVDRVKRLNQEQLERLKGKMRRMQQTLDSVDSDLAELSKLKSRALDDEEMLRRAKEDTKRVTDQLDRQREEMQGLRDKLQENKQLVQQLSREVTARADTSASRKKSGRPGRAADVSTAGGDGLSAHQDRAKSTKLRQQLAAVEKEFKAHRQKSARLIQRLRHEGAEKVLNVTRAEAKTDILQHRLMSSEAELSELRTSARVGGNGSGADADRDDDGDEDTSGPDEARRR